MIIEEEAYLSHYGVKGMQWGVRKQQAASVGRAVGRGAAVTGRVAWRGTKATGRGAKKAAIWAKNNPKAAASIAVGAAFVALALRGKYRSYKISKMPGNPLLNRGKLYASNRIAKSRSLGFPKIKVKKPPSAQQVGRTLTHPFGATVRNGNKIFYGRNAEEAFRKAGAFV